MKNQSQNSATSQIIARARTLTPSARVEFLRQHTVAEVAAIHEALVDEAKPRTPRPVMEKRILAALETAAAPAIESTHDESKPLDEALANDATAASNAASWDAALPELGHEDGDEGHDADDSDDEHDDEGEDDESKDDAAADSTATTTMPITPRRDPRIPPVGTVLLKADRHGKERARCTIVDGGIAYAGTTYKSLSAAAMVAAKDLGLASKTQDGFAFWGLKKGTPRPAKKDAVDGLAKAWERYRESAAAAMKVEGEARAKVHAALSEHVAALQALTAGASA